jgi:YidC/Oxa1 family membrane protein insertase
VLVGFCLLCGGLIIQSGILKTVQPASHQSALPLLQQTTQTQVPSPNQPPPQAITPPALQPAAVVTKGYNAVGGTEERPVIGSTDPQSGFKYQLDLDSRGAAISSVALSEFRERGSNNRQPLRFLSPVVVGKATWMTMVDRPLNIWPHSQDPNFGIGVAVKPGVSWKWLGKQTDAAGTETASFEETIVDSNDRPMLKLTKTYRLARETYLLECTVKIDNLADSKEKVQYNLAGPVGVEREVERADTRKVIAAFVSPQGQITTKSQDKSALLKNGGRSQFPGEGFRWIASVNKYFAAILVPVPDGNDPYCKWAAGRSGVFYNPDGDEKNSSGDETIGADLSTTATTLNPAGQEGSSRSYAFQLYIGPKDKSTFDKNDLYRQLGFVNTFDFQSCCICPTSVIGPLAFAILAAMEWMHGFWPHNYGIVIIILVFLMRLVLHPIMKMSQVSMSKMSKLAPKAEEIKKKYANDKREQQKKMMELYREQGASPIMGFLPMFLQMPIWIALWSAINTSIDLRGAAFLPFWITDLSVPDALISWPPIPIPYLPWHLESLNMLPILMGVAFYFQQKLMPAQAAAATNPQMAQQQKMMNVMMPLLFPLMLYTGPSGVNLYIMASTFAGVVEQQVIRKHIREKEEAEAKGLLPVTSKTGGKFKKKKPKPFYRF